MKAIVISGMPAAGKTTVARLLAQKLNLPVVGGGDILKEMAKDRGYPDSEAEDWWDTKEGIKFLKERETNPEFDKEVDARLAKKIEAGNVIITSYTAPWIAKDGFKIWLNANIQQRAERMAKRDDTAIAKTMKTTKIRDDENYALYKKLYNFEFGRDMVPFDLVIDTDPIPAEEVASIIMQKLKEEGIMN